MTDVGEYVILFSDVSDQIRITTAVSKMILSVGEQVHQPISRLKIVYVLYYKLYNYIIVPNNFVEPTFKKTNPKINIFLTFPNMIPLNY